MCLVIPFQDVDEVIISHHAEDVSFYTGSKLMTDFPFHPGSFQLIEALLKRFMAPDKCFMLTRPIFTIIF